MGRHRNRLLGGFLIIALLALLPVACCFAAVQPPSPFTMSLVPPPSVTRKARSSSSSSSSSSPLLQFLARRRHPATSYPTTMYEQQRHGPDVPPPPPPDTRPESADNFLHFLVTWPFRGGLPEVRAVVVAAMVWTAVVAHLHRQGLVAAVDVTPHSLLSGTLGFFLTFRANQGYNRCNEARAVWDGVLDTSRDIIRSIVACEHQLGGPGPTRRLLDLTCAYGVLLEEFVVGKSNELELSRLLQPKDLEALAAAPPGFNRPLVMTELLSAEVVRAAHARPEFQSSPHYGRILGFIDTLGACNV